MQFFLIDMSLKLINHFIFNIWLKYGMLSETFLEISQGVLKFFKEFSSLCIHITLCIFSNNIYIYSIIQHLKIKYFEQSNW